MNIKLLFLSFFLFHISLSGYALDGCYSSLENDTLTIGNRLIERKFVWNNGNLITYSLTDKEGKQSWLNQERSPDFQFLPGEVMATDATYAVNEIHETVIHPAYLETEVVFSLGDVSVKRVYRIYQDVAAIACETYLKGKAAFGEHLGETNVADRKNIESKTDMHAEQAAAVLDQIKLPGVHWQTKIIAFQDVTDWNNNLVFEKNIIPYRKNVYRGNLLFARNTENGNGFFMLKEAPSSNVQLAYSGHDFVLEFGHFQLTGLGIVAEDLRSDEWRRTYGAVIGVYGTQALDPLLAVRTYQKNIRKLLPGRDEMVMMNTWGDRSQDTKVNEKFCLAEIEKAAELGVTHFQIDDGWQIGKSPNSAMAKGSFKNIWDNPNYWSPDPEKYPRGLQPVVEKGKALGVEVCLWFNPSVQDDYADWEKDAQAMIGLYEQYGIRTFKIDGLLIPTKQSEVNLRKLFDRVLEKTNHQVTFNLDATAGRRGGYHMFNEYGNIFLENRYTDWGNYYPYMTLRNLWMLAKYVPAEKLQIEFLNKWRNADKYGQDPFAPANYSFDYLFALTMAGQPLAWFEASGLPQEAFSVSTLIDRYKKIQHDFHMGVILPIGEEPSGRSWTGFQSIKENTGYLIFYREDNTESAAAVKTWLPEGAEVTCTPVLGEGNAFSQRVGPQGILKIELATKNSFVLYQYDILR